MKNEYEAMEYEVKNWKVKLSKLAAYLRKSENPLFTDDNRDAMDKLWLSCFKSIEDEDKTIDFINKF